MEVFENKRVIGFCFAFTLGNTAEHAVALYHSPLGARFTQAGGIYGRIAFEAETASLADSIKQAEPGLKRRAEELEAQIVEVEKFLPADIVPQYRRLVQNYGASALSPVQGKACGECYVAQRAQTIVELRSGKCIFCTCGRLMYLVE